MEDKGDILGPPIVEANLEGAATNEGAASYAYRKRQLDHHGRNRAGLRQIRNALSAQLFFPPYPARSKA